MQRVVRLICWPRRPAWRLLAALALAGCARSGPAVATGASTASGASDEWAASVFPAATWDSFPAPELAGYRRDRLHAVTRYLEQLPTTAFLVVVHGRVLYRYGDLARLSYLASARKSVLSMLYGKYVENRTINLDRTLADLGIDDRGGLLPSEREATIRDLISARSGVFHPAANPGDHLEVAPPRGSRRHGTYYLYSNWDFNALGTIFEQLTGLDLYDALQSNLASPLQMEDFHRELQHKSGDSTRSRHLAYHMLLSTRDMARLGYLMLRKGRWRDQQLVPEAWVRQSTSMITPSAEMNPPAMRAERVGYGYLWWVPEVESGNPLVGSYAARGAYGQYILVAPKLDLVVAHQRAVEDREVTPVLWLQFMEVVERVVSARCGRRC